MSNAERSSWFGAAVMVAATTGLVAGIGAVDYLTGPKISLSVFYLVPVSVAAWYSGRKLGMAIAVLSGAVWLAADVLADIAHANVALACWNAMVRLAFFVTVCLLIVRVRLMNERLAENVRTKSLNLEEEKIEHRQTRGELRASEERFRRLIESVKDSAMFMLDQGGVIADWNKGAERLLRYEEGEIVGRDFSILYPPAEVARGRCSRAIARATSDGSFEDEGWRIRKDGTRIWASASLAALAGQDGSARGFSLTIHDLTDRKELEDSLLRSEEAQQRRVGRDLHDTLGQDLTGIAFLAKELEDELAEKSPADSAAARRIVSLIGQATDHVRALARGLCPVELTANGLMVSLEHLAQTVASVFKVACRLECARPVLVRDDAVAMHLYQIAREAVTNAVKHGQAEQVLLRLASEDGRIVLSVEDNGVGISGKPNTSGFGLRAMAYRARSISGVFSIEPGVGGGTVVRCSAPASAG